MDEQYVEKLHRDMDGIRIDSGVPTETSSITDADVEETKDDHALYEIRLTSRKGFGLFAIRDIPRGTRIIAEPALVAVPASAPDFEHAWKEFKKLTPEQYDAMAGLTYQLSTSNPGIPALVRQRQTNGKQYEGIALTALNVVVEDETKMRAIFSTNAVEMGPEGRYGHGLFLLSSRINHSCCPNVQQVYNATLGMNTIYASREIKQDEEILCSYIEYLRKDPEERTEALAQWRFKCDCTACKGPEVTVREGRRQKICELAAGLPKYGAGTLGFSTPNTPDKALAWAEERVGLLKKQGLEDMELASAYRSCSKYSYQLGQPEKAMAYARKELDVQRYCLGTETAHLEEEGAEFWIKHLEQSVGKDRVRITMNQKRTEKEEKRAEKKAAKKAGKGAR